VEGPRLRIQLRRTDTFCQLITGRLNVPLALLTRKMRLHGDRRLFLRMNDLFSAEPNSSSTR
jgi:putative sterol carrier protein